MKYNKTLAILSRIKAEKPEPEGIVEICFEEYGLDHKGFNGYRTYVRNPDALRAIGTAVVLLYKLSPLSIYKIKLAELSRLLGISDNTVKTRYSSAILGISETSDTEELKQRVLELQIPYYEDREPSVEICYKLRQILDKTEKRSSGKDPESILTDLCLSIEDVIGIRITPEEILERNGTHMRVFRNLAYYAIKEIGHITLEQAARALGRSDHKQPMIAVRKIEYVLGKLPKKLTDYENSSEAFNYLLQEALSLANGKPISAIELIEELENTMFFKTDSDRAFLLQHKGALEVALESRLTSIKEVV